MSKKVCVLLNNEYIWDNRVERGVESLTNAGYQVSVFAVADPKSELPQRQEKNGAIIYRIFPERLPKYAPLRWQKLLTYVWQIHQSGAGPFDIFHAHNADTLQLAHFLSRWYRRPLVYDAHEWWDAFFELRRQKIEEELLTVQNPDKLKKALVRLQQMEQLEARLITRCQGFISVCDSLCELYQKKAEAPLSNVVTLRNIPPYFSLPAALSKRFHEHFNLSPEQQVVLYQGALSESRGIELVLEAWKILNNPNLVLVLMGQARRDYLTTIKQQIELHGLNNILFKEPVYGDEFLSWTQSANLGLAPILNHNLSYYYCLPNKIFEYVQAELPIAVSNFPEMAKVVNQYRIGFTFDPEQSEDLAQKIRHYFDSPQQQAEYRHHIQQAKPQLTWENEEKRLLDLYQTILSS